MNRLLIASMIAICAGGVAFAATVTNLDDDEHTITISEDGNQTDFTIAPGETIEICPLGCFITLPNGDREALTGTETLEIEASRGRVF